MTTRFPFWMGAIALLLLSCGNKTVSGESNNKKSSASPEVTAQVNPSNPTSMSAQLDTATFGAGCFWCVEAIFQNVNGVDTVISGYTGGSVKNPTYKEVCSGRTGHAEVAQITYDPTVVNYETLLEIFWQTHDPTTLNRQGADVGTQYRSAVFYHNDNQKQLAGFYLKKLDESGIFSAKIVTEIVPLTVFYPAEDYHQNYFRQNENQPYCQAVIRPKVEKFRKVFGEKMKK